MKKIIVLISGSGSNLQAIIDDCNAKRIDAEIACVISNNPNAFGLERAKLAGIKTIVINHKEFVSRELFDNELYILLKKHNPELIKRQRMIVFSKVDLIDKTFKTPKINNEEIISISSVTGKGIKKLISLISSKLKH